RLGYRGFGGTTAVVEPAVGGETRSGPGDVTGWPLITTNPSMPVTATTTRANRDGLCNTSCDPGWSRRRVARNFANVEPTNVTAARSTTMNRRLRVRSRSAASASAASTAMSMAPVNWIHAEGVSGRATMLTTGRVRDEKTTASPLERSLQLGCRGPEQYSRAALPNQ